ncbi:hypothetical protein CCHR01_05032 [Colletotrichum chrysophilum]|uniref:Uncharacterized protein n=1 Tax=Colletotrichum chrysophilum TaxID=1836956 RepID=A0AAD9ATA7_9PEZI|nr:hypothetical protein CCHR01_05032 [Colletotrichum chrysophilum]
MTSRDSIVWLPKELYSSVERFADPEHFIWCPMPFDDSLPLEQTSFIHMKEEEEEIDIREPVVEPVSKNYDRNRDSGIDLSMDYEVSPPPSVHIPDEPTDPSSSESESDKDVPSREPAQDASRGKRRQRRRPPMRHDSPKPEEPKGPTVRESRSFAVHLGLNLNVEVSLKARVYGGLELSML